MAAPASEPWGMSRNALGFVMGLEEVNGQHAAGCSETQRCEEGKDAAEHGGAFLCCRLFPSQL